LYLIIDYLLTYFSRPNIHKPSKERRKGKTMALPIDKYTCPFPEPISSKTLTAAYYLSLYIHPVLDGPEEKERDNEKIAEKHCVLHGTYLGRVLCTFSMDIGDCNLDEWSGCLLAQWIRYADQARLGPRRGDGSIDLVGGEAPALNL
jgi:hypothetical protein